jgi:hypothetical protein
MCRCFQLVARDKSIFNSFLLGPEISTSKVDLAVIEKTKARCMLCIFNLTLMS